MSTEGKRRICFAGSAVEVEYHGERAAHVVDFLYRHMPTCDDLAPQASFLLEQSGERLALYRDDRKVLETDSDSVMAEFLLGETGVNLATSSRGGLLFHAGALTWDGKGLLLPGSIGAGKTTLTAWLALTGAGGLEYLSDEMAFVPDGAESMQTYTRPLNVKAPARDALRPFFDFEADADRVLGHEGGCLVPPELVSFSGPRAETPVSLVVFPRYVTGAELALEPLSKARAGLALMECLVNARNLPDHGFAEIARLARLAPAYRLRYSRFEQLEGRIEDLLR